MHSLQVGPDWAAQIAVIRDAHTDDSNVIRFDNSFYRCCRAAAPPFELQVRAGEGGAGVSLKVDPRDFYMKPIGGKPMERYASTIGDAVLNADLLDHAITRMAAGTDDGEKGFLLRSLLVFAIAESIRFDHFATAVDQTLRAARTQIKGVGHELPLGRWSRTIHLWGQASEAVLAALTPAMRGVVQRPRASLSGADRTRHERVDLAAARGDLRECARSMKVLKRTGA